jgi:geranylgeranyl diphosphate synthase type I
MEMDRFFQETKKSIAKHLEEFFHIKADELSQVNRWGRDLMMRFADFSIQGKMIRGGLIILSYRMFKHHTPPWVLDMAAAMEIAHTALLIHDDIMDRDRLRRGKKTIFYQYEELGEREKSSDPLHFGESLGMCAGDIGFFLAFELLSRQNNQHKLASRIFPLWSQELSGVGLAQMQDVYFSASYGTISEQDILDLYRFKTARYTFSLPLMTGALAAGQPHEMVTTLSELGECYGIMFQLRDDELGLYGDESIIGKPIGTDIKEGKKTLFAYYLLEKTDREFREQARAILSKKKINRSTLSDIREIVDKAGVRSRLEQKMQELKTQTSTIIDSLKVPLGYKDFLQQILHFNIERHK